MEGEKDEQSFFVCG